MASKNLGNLFVSLSAKTGDFMKDMKKAGDSVQALADVAEKVRNASAIAFAGMTASIGLATKAASEQIEAQNQLALALRNTGQSADITAFNELAGQLQATTKFSDDAALGAAGLLVKLGATADQARTMLPAVADLAQAMGMDLESAAMLAGKALGGQTEALGRYGIRLSEADKKTLELGSDSEKLAVIMQNLGKFQGAAAEGTKTAAGAFTQMQNALGEVSESFGMILDKPLSDFFHGVSDMANDAAKYVSELSPEMKTLAGNLTLASAGFLGVGAGMASVVAMLPDMVKGFMILKPLAATVFFPITAAVAALSAGFAAAVVAFQLLQKGINAWQSDIDNIIKKLSGNGKTSALGGALQFVIDQIKLISKHWAKAFGDGKKDQPEWMKGMQAIPLVDEGGKIIDYSGKSGNGDAPKWQGAEFDFEKAQADFLWGGSVLAPPALPGTNRGGTMSGGGGTVGGGSGAGDAGVGQAAFAKMKEFEGKILNTAIMVGDRVRGAMGFAGQVMTNAFEGFQQGGAMGAISSVITDLLLQAPAMQQAFQMLNDFLGRIVMALNPLVRALLPAFAMFLSPLNAIVNVIGELFAQLEPTLQIFAKLFVMQFMPYIVIASKVLKALAPALNSFAMLLETVTYTFASIINGIISMLQSVLRPLSDLPFGIGDAFDSVIDTLEDFKLTFDNSYVMADMPDDANELAGAMDNLTKTTNSVTESLTNVPQGFKVAAARYGAITPGLGASVPLGAGGSARTNIFNQGAITIVNQDPVKIWEKLKRVMEADNFNSTGTTIQTASPFALPSYG